tara:strand:+ start:12535 stop:13728 length:1194 start_codon:yes stop_codon:yes gene_type:complete
MTSKKDLIIKWHNSIQDICEADWVRLNYECKNPFYKWNWLNLLEKSGSISPKYGWQPLYLSITRKNKPIACAPLYLKGHSFGEFIFDHQFVDLAKILEVNYYPKLIGMSPLSPVEGYRFLFAPNEDKEYLTKLIIKAIDDFCIKNEILSCNFLYVDSEWQLLAEKAGCAKWLNINSMWNAGNAKDFSCYLESFNANQRRNIKRERNSIKKSNLKISVKSGSDINTAMMRSMYKFYEKHCARWGPWGSKYLSENFFVELASSNLKDQIILFIATKNDSRKPIAMSMFLRNENMLWGRYWGSEVEINNLHFELCYYSPIEWALKKGIKSFDPGAGGSHKRRRGFIARPQVSMHKWYNTKMDTLIRQWLPQVNKLISEEIKATNNEVPFKKNQPKLSLME